MVFFRAAHGWGGGGVGGVGGGGGGGGGKSVTHTYNDETWHSYTLPKEDAINI